MRDHPIRRLRSFLEQLALALTGNPSDLQTEARLTDLERDLAALRHDHNNLNAIVTELYVGSEVTP
jgi:hypothetical protein